jgi:hypothetical protein
LSEYNNKWARKPKPESHPDAVHFRMYRAYAPDGTSKGTVRLNPDGKKRYEARGFTFKAVHS